MLKTDSRQVYNLHEKRHLDDNLQTQPNDAISKEHQSNPNDRSNLISSSTTPRSLRAQSNMSEHEKYLYNILTHNASKRFLRSAMYCEYKNAGYQLQCDIECATNASDISDAKLWIVKIDRMRNKIGPLHSDQISAITCFKVPGRSPTYASVKHHIDKCKSAYEEINADLNLPLSFAISL